MSKLYNTAQVKTGYTANGAVTNLSSLNPCVDLFFLAGASRGKDISTTFHKALDEDPEITGRMLLWLRDVLQGAGEREQFRKLFKELIYKDIKLSERVLRKIPVAGIGRWDDVLEAFGTPLQDVAVEMCITALNNKDALCAKWMPRRKKGKANTEFTVLVKTFTEGNLPYKQKEAKFRKYVSELSNTIEQQMCTKEWSKINYNHVPSKASQVYRKAFLRNDEARYRDYLDSLVKGSPDVKVNAKATFPHDILNMAFSGRGRSGYNIANKESVALAEAQWNALPDFVQGSEEKIMPLVDVSGSMNGTPMEVAVSLGVYFAQRNKGEFAGEVMTFTSTPSFVKVPQGLVAGAKAVFAAPWGMSTDIQVAFELILQTAIKGGLSQKDLPTKLLVLSDMEFNSSYVKGTSTTAFKAAKNRFELHDYKLPEIIFWNLRGRVGNNPVTIHDTGTALVSGFSPSILTAVLKGADDLTPVNVMLAKLMDERYDF